MKTSKKEKITKCLTNETNIAMYKITEVLMKSTDSTKVKTVKIQGHSSKRNYKRYYNLPEHSNEQKK